MELSCSNIKKFLVLFRETETKKILYISGNGNPKKLLRFQEIELFIPSLKNKKKSTQENFLYSGKMEELSSSNIKTFLTFSQEKVCLIF